MPETDHNILRCINTEVVDPGGAVLGGGAAIDVDTEAEYDAVCERYEEWRALQGERARQFYGALAGRTDSSGDDS